jgi:hypothetical protein
MASREAALVIAWVLVSMTLFSATPSSAHWQDPGRNWYSFESDCTGWVDPITFAFKGEKSHWSEVAPRIQNATGWSNQEGGNQTFPTHSACYYQGSHRASGCNTCERYHVRIFWAHAGYNGREDYSVATPHYEKSSCFVHWVLPDYTSGGSGFTKAKQKLRDKLKAPNSGPSYYMSNVNIGNTAGMAQYSCGSWIGNASNQNGYIWVVHMGQVGPY